ncbi:MAG: AMP-binding protein [Gemmatimonadota bacterium]
MRSPVPPRFSASPDPIRWWARVAPGRIALVDRAHDQRYTYAELDALADAWRVTLSRLEIGRGDRVATLASNRAAQPALLYACARLGAVLVPLNWRLAPRELARVLANARPAVVVGEARFRGLAEQAGAGLPETRWIEMPATGDAPPPDAAPRTRSIASDLAASGDVPLDGEEPALILYTSGSTGVPKGAVLPHRQLFYNAVATTTAWELGADDVAPVSTPFFHTGGWNVFATPLWQCGGRIVLFDQFDPAGYLEGLAAEGCTVALTVPTQLILLLESAAWGAPVPSLRFFISGGAPCPVSVMERVRRAGFAMKEGFGLTECGPNCFVMPTDEAPRRPGRVGWPVPFLEMRLTGDGDRDVATDDVGELLLRGPQLFSGYFDDPQRTAEALDEDGWFHTGDLATRDRDGAYRICGRRNEMFISGGENVYPGEVESVLIEHPAVAEVTVIGVRDETWGEVGRAFVVARRGTTLMAEELLRWARVSLAGYKVPKTVAVLDELPKLGSGKVDRAQLAQLAQQRGGEMKP